MYEHGQTWTIEHPDGSTFQLNANNGVYLEEVTGFDSPTVRPNVEDLPEADGAVAGDYFYGSRPVTLRGRIGNVTASDRNQLVMNLQRATRGLRQNIVLRSQPSGLPEMRVQARLEGLRVTGGFVKEFLISLNCADPRIYSQALNALTAIGSTTSTGAAFPWSFPVNFGGGIATALSVTANNAGNSESPPVVRVWGPLDNPVLHNDTYGDLFYLDNLQLGAGQFVDVDMSARTVTRSDGTSAYDKVRFPASAWWTLRPGSNLIRVFGSNEGAGAEIDVSWRDSWL